MRFGVVGSGRQVGEMPDGDLFRKVASTAERLDYDSLWATDHISCGNPILEGVVALGYFAGCTTRITLGVGVYLLALRHPSLAAKQLASLSALAGDRLIVGIGVGGESPADFRAVEVSMTDRGRRTDEAIDAVRALWSGPGVTYRSERFALTDVSLDPRPEQLPPMWIGGRSDPALRRAGTRGDGWLAYLQSPSGVAHGSRQVRDHAERTGRDPASLDVGVMVPTLVEDDQDSARTRMRQHLALRYGWEVEPHVVDRYCLAGPPEHCVDRLAKYREAGASHVVFNLGCEPDAYEDQMEILAETFITRSRSEPTRTSHGEGT